MGRILIVEDDLVIQSMLRMALTRRGHEPIAIADGVSALDCITQSCPDLIVLDLWLPIMDGWEFLKIYTNTALDILPIILISAGNIQKDAYGFPGVVDYFVKPFNLDELLSCIDENLAIQ